MKNEKKILTCVGIGVIALIVFGWNDTARLAQAKEEAAVNETKQEIVIDRGEVEITPATVVKTYTESELLRTSEIERDKEDVDSERARTYGTSGNGVAGDSELQETADDNGIGSEDSGDNVSTDTGANENLYEASGDGSDAEVDSGESEVDGEGYTDPAAESEPDTAVVGETEQTVVGDNASVDSYANGYYDSSGLVASGRSEPEYTEPSLTYLGQFTATAYCACPICTGEYSSGYTASGTLATEGRTVACNVLPMGTQIYVDGHGYYTVEDTGWSPYGDAWLDFFFESHDSALAFGLRTVDVYLVN